MRQQTIKKKYRRKYIGHWEKFCRWLKEVFLESFKIRLTSKTIKVHGSRIPYNQVGGAGIRSTPARPAPALMNLIVPISHEKEAEQNDASVRFALNAPGFTITGQVQPDQAGPWIQEVLTKWQQSTAGNPVSGTDVEEPPSPGHLRLAAGGAKND